MQAKTNLNSNNLLLTIIFEQPPVKNISSQIKFDYLRVFSDALDFIESKTNPKSLIIIDFFYQIYIW